MPRCHSCGAAWGASATTRSNPATDSLDASGQKVVDRPIEHLARVVAGALRRRRDDRAGDDEHAEQRSDGAQRIVYLRRSRQTSVFSLRT